MTKYERIYYDHEELRKWKGRRYFNLNHPTHLWFSSSSDSKTPCGFMASTRASVRSTSASVGCDNEIGAVIPKCVL